MPHGEFMIRAHWDEEAKVWFVAESDIPGLSAEGETVEILYSKLCERIPELVALNRHLIDWEPDGDLPIHLMAERMDKVRVGR